MIIYGIIRVGVMDYINSRNCRYRSKEEGDKFGIGIFVFLNVSIRVYVLIRLY